jgi:hypothetical protein
MEKPQSSTENPHWERKYIQELGELTENKDWEDRRLRRRVKET